MNSRRFYCDASAAMPASTRSAVTVLDARAANAEPHFTMAEKLAAVMHAPAVPLKTRSVIAT